MLLETLIHFYVCEMDIDVYLFIIQFSIFQEHSKAYYIFYYILMTMTCHFLFLNTFPNKNDYV